MTSILSSNNNNDSSHSITQVLCSLLKAGFKLVPLSDDHKPMIQWGSVYEDLSYWQIEKLSDPKIYSNFKNVASALGKTHVKDQDNKDLYIQVLDCHSEYVYKVLATATIAQLYSEKKYDFTKDGLKLVKENDDNFSKLTLLDVLKQKTFVTKTKKPYGIQIWWLSHNQNLPISSVDCKKGYEFEIKTDKKTGLCTLPPSTHRNDRNFRYMEVGQTDKILIDDQLYGLFNELFADILTKKINLGDAEEDGNTVNGNKDTTPEKDGNCSTQKSELQQPKDLEFYNLSQQTIKQSVSLLLPYYKEGNRHNFALLFSGTTFNSRVSEESAASIMEGICDSTKDLDEKQDRLYTLRSTYKKGIKGTPITGGPTFAELLKVTNDCELSEITDLINELKKMWQQHIPRELSIAVAKREKSGFVKVTGTIIGISSVYLLIKSVTTECALCDWKNTKVFSLPKFETKFKENDNCPSCLMEDSSFTNTATAMCEYVTVVDLELQDMDGCNDIERLPVKVFEKDTYNIAVGEKVTITGHLHPVRKNDSIKNKLETVLFADSIVFIKRQELILTNEDIQKIKEWKQFQEEQGNNPVDELVILVAPELIDLDTVKKGVLLVCVNAGLANVDNRFPKSLRINALLIGDPGLAKTSMLEKAAKLVPNSQQGGGQSSTGLSLTAQVSKEDGGVYTLRFGPIVLAKDSICAINELGQLPIEEHKHFLDCMEENGLTIAKYGFATTIEAHPSIIATANPINNRWQNSETVNFREFPTLSQVIQRFDLIFIFRENTDPSYLARYVDERKKIADDYKNGLCEHKEEFIKKYLLYAKSFRPILTNQAYSLLKDLYINMGKAGITGLPRKLESLIRITIAITKLKLKDVADVEDAQDAMLFYNDTLKDFNQASTLAVNPRDRAYEEIRKTIKENKGSPVLLTEAALMACDRNEDARYYLLGRSDDDSTNIRDSPVNLSVYHLLVMIIYK